MHDATLLLSSLLDNTSKRILSYHCTAPFHPFPPSVIIGTISSQTIYVFHYLKLSSMYYFHVVGVKLTVFTFVLFMLILTHRFCSFTILLLL
jgi:hypothetical protein